MVVHLLPQLITDLPPPLKRVHLKDQIMDKMKGGRNAKKWSVDGWNESE